MRVTNKMISIPPYISTSWRNVHSVHMTDGVLVVTLADGEAVYIPDLTLQEIDLIFKAHTTYLEAEDREETPRHTPPKSSMEAQAVPTLLQSFLGGAGGDTGQSPIRVAFGNLENLGAVMQHNQAQANTPDLPHEVLEKISSIAKWMAPEDAQSLPKAEPHCNCIHCQITRAITGQVKTEEPKHVEPADQEVSADELRFQQWNIEQTGENLFVVTNKLDKDEKYSVYLGEPLGCTCGKTGCEHLIAVLEQ